MAASAAISKDEEQLDSLQELLRRHNRLANHRQRQHPAQLEQQQRQLEEQISRQQKLQQQVQQEQLALLRTQEQRIAQQLYQDQSTLTVLLDSQKGNMEPTYREDELTIDEIQRILDLPASALLDIANNARPDDEWGIIGSEMGEQQQQLEANWLEDMVASAAPPTRLLHPQSKVFRLRSDSSTYQASSPESGISGCETEARSPDYSQAMLHSPENRRASPAYFNVSGPNLRFIHTPSSDYIELAAPPQSPENTLMKDKLVTMNYAPSGVLSPEFGTGDGQLPVVYSPVPVVQEMATPLASINMADYGIDISDLIQFNGQPVEKPAVAAAPAPSFNRDVSVKSTSVIVLNQSRDTVLASGPKIAFSVPGFLTFGATARPQAEPKPLLEQQQVDLQQLQLSNIPTTVEEEEVMEIKEEEEGEYFCQVCGEPAGRHSYYGGQVCASCRAFFRRSVQSKYYELFACKKEQNCPVDVKNRKSCQFCRFKKCLSAGMKVSWVLSDEERNRRFNKFNKVQMKSVTKQDRHIKTSRLPEIYMAFTMEEQNLLGQIQEKMFTCTNSWLIQLIDINKEAGINMIESAYNLKPLEYRSWKLLEQSFETFFVKAKLPSLADVGQLPFLERSIMLSGDNPRIAHTFKMSMVFRGRRSGSPPPPSKAIVPHVPPNTVPKCALDKQVKDIAQDEEFMENLGLKETFERLKLNDVEPSIPGYDEMFPKNWANNPAVESRHREINQKIVSWPKDEHNQTDVNMMMLMTVIILFNSDFTPLKNRERVEALQMRYILLLQRYLRSRMDVRRANTKFLEGMLLISYVKEMWELSKLHVEEIGAARRYDLRPTDVMVLTLAHLSIVEY